MEKGKSAFLVTGDPARNKELCLPGGGFATVKIELPAAWNQLMAARGYQPLDSFRLTSDLKPDTPPRNNRRFRSSRLRGGAPGSVSFVVEGIEEGKISLFAI